MSARNGVGGAGGPPSSRSNYVNSTRFIPEGDFSFYVNDRTDTAKLLQEVYNGIKASLKDPTLHAIIDSKLNEMLVPNKFPGMSGSQKGIVHRVIQEISRYPNWNEWVNDVQKQAALRKAANKAKNNNISPPFSRIEERERLSQLFNRGRRGGNRKTRSSTKSKKSKKSKKTRRNTA